MAEDHEELCNDLVLSKVISGEAFQISSSHKLNPTRLNSLNLNDSEHKTIMVSKFGLEIPQQKTLVSKPISILSNLTPQKANYVPLTEEETSPVLGSDFSRRDCKQFLTSTPADLTTDTSSPENRKNDNVLSALNRLCSPILKKQSVELSDNPHVKSTQTKNKSLRPSKRLFSDTFDYPSSPCSKRIKQLNIYNRTQSNDSDITDVSDSYITDVSDPFKVHDISEHTLQALCEATDHIVDNFEVEELKTEEKLDENVCKEKKKESSIINKQLITQPTKNSSVPVKIHNSQESIGDFEENKTLNNYFKNSSLIYKTCFSKLNNTKNISINDLFESVKILEEAKNKTNNKSVCNNHNTLNNDIKNQLWFSNISMRTNIKGYTNELNRCTDFKKPYEFKSNNYELMNADESMCITDTQYCEVVDAVEMVTAFEQPFNKSPDNTIDIAENRIENFNISNHGVNLLNMNSILPEDCAELSNTSEEISKQLFDEEKLHKTSKTIQVSEKSDNKSKDLFYDKELLRSSKFKCFQTEGGKIVNVLEESFNRAKHLLDIKELCGAPISENITTTNGKTVKNAEESIKRTKQLFDDEELYGTQRFEGFQTKSDKTVKVSENSIKKVKEPFNGEELEVIHKFEGFQTAAGKPVKVSEDLIKKARQLFDADELNECPVFKSCETVGDKTVNVSEESIKKGKQLFNDKEHCGAPKFEGFQTSGSNTVKISEDSIKKAKELFDVGELCGASKYETFQTAGGKNVKVSEHSINNTKALFDGAELHGDPKFEGFKTAGGKMVKVSEDSIRKAKQLFNGEELCGVPVYEDLTTADGKNAKASEDSIRKAKQLFDGDELCEAPVYEDFLTAGENTDKLSEDSIRKSKQLMDDDELCGIPKFKGFQTAGGKTVEVSEDSIRKAKQLFDREELCVASVYESFLPAGGKTDNVSEDLSRNVKMLINVEEFFETAKFKGFQTAGGKTVQVSEDSIKKAKQLFDGEELCGVTVCEDSSTAVVKNVKISEDSTGKANQLIDEGELCGTLKFKGFQTAGGKTIQVSEDSIKKAKQLFDGEELCGVPVYEDSLTTDDKHAKVSDDSIGKAKQLINDEELCGVPKFKGFQTAGGKTVEVSEDSIRKAKQLFDGEELSGVPVYEDSLTTDDKHAKVSDYSIGKAKQLINDGEHCGVPKFKGFQTAGGKIVQVSEDSIRKAKQLFDGEELCGVPVYEDSLTTDDKHAKVSDDSIGKAKQLINDGEHCGVPKFKGFQTAGGKTVQVSEDSIRKAKQLFDGEELCGVPVYEDSLTTYDKHAKISEDSTGKANQLIDEGELCGTLKFKGFQTAGGKTIQVSEDSIRKAKQLFDGEELCGVPVYESFLPGITDKVSVNSSRKAKQLIDEDLLRTAKFKGFQTAGGKTVQVSEDSIRKAKQLFDGEELCGIQVCEDSLTAVGKNVKISEDSTGTAKHLIDDGELCGIPKFKGFQTAGGKTVQVSEDSIRKAKQLFDGEELDGAPVYESFLPGITDKVSVNSSRKAKQLIDEDLLRTAKFKGFQTAGGKTVQVSEDSIRKAKQLFDGEELCGIQVCEDSLTAVGKNVKISEDSTGTAKHLIDDGELCGIPKFKGFQTAGGKTVQVSEDSIRKAKQLFDGEELDGAPVYESFLPAITDKVSDNSSRKAKQLIVEDLLGTAKFKGFQTAGGKTVQVSEDSIRKAKQLFDGEELCGIQVCEDSLTAVGKNVKISEDSTGTAKHLIDDGELCGISKFRGFQTAGGKTVQVSEDSIRKAKQLFDGEELDGAPVYESFLPGITDKVSVNSSRKAKQLIDEDLLRTAKFKGFQTAGGKTVQVSEDSIRKAKQLFDGEELCGIQVCEDSLTAVGKNVKISEDSTGTAKHLIDDGELCGIPKFKGFQTAGGKTVQVSEDSIRKAKQLFDGEELDGAPVYESFLPAITDKVSDNSSRKAKQLIVEDLLGTAKFKGFQTAGGKTVQVSEDSIRKAKQLFDGEELCGVQVCEDSLTAVGKNVKISEDSTGKAKQLIDDGKLCGISKFKGFQTAGGKTVEISEDSIKRVKQVFEDDVLCDLPKMEYGKTVKLSDETSKSAKRLLFGKGSVAKEITVSQALVEKTVIASNKSHISGNHQCDIKKQLYKPKFSKPCNSKDFVNNTFAEISDEAVNNAKDLEYGDINVIKATNSNSEFNKNIIPQKCNKANIKVRKRTRENDVSDMDIMLPHKIPRNLVDGNEYHSRPKVFDFQSPVTRGLNFSSTCLSVISEEDLNLLNQSLTDTSKLNSSFRQNENQDVGSDKNLVLSPSVAREVSESMAALMADEESSPFSQSFLKPCLSSPSMIFDRQLKLPPIDCFENDIHFNDKQISPILGSSSHFKSTKRCSKKLLQSPDHNFNHNCKNSTPLTKNGSFKFPYATSTPNEITQKVNRFLKHENLEIAIEEENKSGLKYCNDALLIELAAARKKAAGDQENFIKEKIKSSKSIRPCKGSYLLRKQTETGKNLKNLAEHKPLQPKELGQLVLLGIKRSVIKISASNAIDFSFFAKDYFSEEIYSSNIDGIPVGDGAHLIFNEEGKAGVTEVTRAFLASPSVDPSLISAEWVKNHYRWIVLKMAATERMFPEQLANRYLTPDNLMLQLKYRYDREIDMCQRSALRKILEKDESSSKPMVLFVADILNVKDQAGGGNWELVLSDGWYSVTASVDREMSLMVQRSRVRVGTKLLVIGADLINNDDGCNPLEIPANVRLRLCTNSARRARWHARLGFHPHLPPPARLQEVLARGGTVPALSATVTRTYPLLFLEKLPGGKTVLRGERAEQTASDMYQLKRQQCAETILSQLQHEADTAAKNSRSKQQPVTRRCIRQAKNTKELLSLLEGVEDTSIFQEVLTKDQLSALQEQRQEEASHLQQQLQEKLVRKLDEKMAPRKITRMLKVRLAEEDKQADRSALFTVWNPSDDVVSLLAEGNSLIFHNLTASGYSRYGDLQLTSGRQTRYSLQGHCDVSRQVTPLSDLQNSYYRPQFSEVDVVGVVLPMSDTTEPARLVYVADANYHFLGISFWTKIKDTGFVQMISPGSIISASNLHWNCNVVSWNLPTVFATEMSSFSQNPRQSHLNEALHQFKDQLGSLDLKTYIDECVRRIKLLLTQRNSGGSEQTLVTTPNASVLNSSSGYKERLLLKTTVAPSPRLNSSDTVESCDTLTSQKLAWLEEFGKPPPLPPLALSTPARVRRSLQPPKKKFCENR